MKKKIQSKEKIKAKTVFQSFADWLALHADERDEKFEVTVSDRAFVAVRSKLAEVD